VAGVRVAVNLLWCVPGKVGGSEDYLVRQLLGLSSADPEASFAPTVYAAPGLGAAHPDLAERVPIVEAPLAGASRPRRVLVEHTWLGRRTRDAELVHHGGGTMPTPIDRRARRVPTVLTIHDLQYRTYPEYLNAVKRRYLAWAIPHSVHRATVITVPSEYVRSTVIDAYGVDPARVIVVPHGIEPTLGAAATPEAQLRRAYRLGNGPVIVLPAMTHPHKGHRFLLRLMAERWTDPELRLVLTGGAGSAENDVMADVAKLRLSARVVRAGRVPPADRDGLLAMATAMVFPSEYEGFGAPVIEAMALGAPVICSDRTCLPEVAGDAAIVRPLELDAWADALDEAVGRRAALVAAGHRRAAQFTASRSAEALITAYRSAL
jgi:alpha-1,3-rhamnosyl/mannosyltransferase